MTLQEALTYKPVELSFGTSGLRGLVKDMTDLECYINVAGFLCYLRSIDDVQNGDVIHLAGDLRDSTPRIMQVVAQACYDQGLKVVNCGLIPTPAVAYYARINNAACIMVTGSHIPSDRNGIKFYKTEGEILKADEQSIQEHVAQVRATTYEYDANTSEFDATGSLKNMANLPDVEKRATKLYKQRYTDYFGVGVLSGKTIVFYQHSAVGRDVIVEILEELGASVLKVERSDSFVPIDTENVTQEYKEKFVSFARQHPGAFAIVSTDGDSDRPFVIDETGTFHRGDMLGMIVADYLGAEFAAVPISSNDAVDAFCVEKGIVLAHTKIGSPFVIEAMQAAAAQGLLCGWEVNGGFLTGSDITTGGKILRSLPTRDALLPIICALLSATQKKQPVSRLFAGLPKRFTGGGLIDNIPLEKIATFKRVCLQEGVIRKIAGIVFPKNDLGLLESIDLTDGLRLKLTSGNVIHLRPSGNAPQFRVYTNASLQTVADDLAQKATCAGGYIEKILNEL